MKLWQTENTSIMYILKICILPLGGEDEFNYHINIYDVLNVKIKYYFQYKQMSRW